MCSCLLWFVWWSLSVRRCGHTINDAFWNRYNANSEEDKPEIYWHNELFTSLSPWSAFYYILYSHVFPIFASLLHLLARFVNEWLLQYRRIICRSKALNLNICVYVCVLLWHVADKRTRGLKTGKRMALKPHPHLYANTHALQLLLVIWPQSCKSGCTVANIHTGSTWTSSLPVISWSTGCSRHGTCVHVIHLSCVCLSNCDRARNSGY